MPIRRGFDSFGRLHDPWTKPCIFCDSEVTQDVGHSWCPQCGMCIVCGLEPQESNPVPDVQWRLPESP